MSRPYSTLVLRHLTPCHVHVQLPLVMNYVISPRTTSMLTPPRHALRHLTPYQVHVQLPPVMS